MREYQPWDDSWQEDILYIMIPPRVEIPVEMVQDFPYPIFLGAFSQGVKGEDFWKAIAAAMVYVIGHQPDHPQASSYVHWINSYNPAIVKELIYDGADQATRSNLETAIWLLQAAVLLDPTMAEAHYNLGLAFYQLGLKHLPGDSISQGDQSLQQAARYLQNSVELDPNFSLAYYNLGSVYKHMGMPGESAKYLEKGVLLGLDRIAGQTSGASGSQVKGR